MQADRKALFNSFSREFFRKKQFMLSDRSLQALVDIAHHPTLSPCLRHLIIGLDRFEYTGHCRFSTPARALAYRAAAAEQFHLVTTGQAVSGLATALAALQNLETVDIRDFSSATASATGPGALAQLRRPHRRPGDGHPAVQRQPAAPRRVRLAGLRHCPRCLGHRQCPPTALEVILRNKSSGLADVAFHVSARLQDSVMPMLAGLRKLHIDVNLNKGQPIIGLGAHNHNQAAPGVNRAETSAVFKAFLGMVPNLRFLRINFQTTFHINAEAFLIWLTRAEMPGSRSPLFPELESLELGSVEVTPKTLLRTVSRFPTVFILGLWGVVLHDPTPQDERINLWVTFFRRLAASARLRALLVGRLSQQKPLSTPYAAVFRNAASPDKPDVERNSSKTKETLQAFLEKLAADCKVLWPDPPADTDADDDDPGDDGDNEVLDAAFPTDDDLDGVDGVDDHEELVADMADMDDDDDNDDDDDGDDAENDDDDDDDDQDISIL